MCSERKKLRARVWVRAPQRQSYLATCWEHTVSTVVTYRIWMYLETIIFKALLRNLKEVTERLPRGLFGMPIDKIKIRLQGCRKVEDLYVNKANSPAWQSQEMSGNRKEATLTATVRLETGSSLLYHKTSRYERNAISTLTTFRANIHCWPNSDSQLSRAINQTREWGTPTFPCLPNLFYSIHLQLWAIPAGHRNFHFDCSLSFPNLWLMSSFLCAWGVYRVSFRSGPVKVSSLFVFSASFVFPMLLSWNACLALADLWQALSFVSRCRFRKWSCSL